MIIAREDIYWMMFCISETFREENINTDMSIHSIVDLMPYGIIKKSATMRNATPACEWVMEHLGYEYENTLEKWVKKYG